MLRISQLELARVRYCNAISDKCPIYMRLAVAPILIEGIEHTNGSSLAEVVRVGGLSFLYKGGEGGDNIETVRGES